MAQLVWESLYVKCASSLWPHGLYPARLFCPRNSPGKNTGMGCHFLLQDTFKFSLNKQVYNWSRWAEDLYIAAGYSVGLLSRFSRVRLCVTPIDGSPPGSAVPGILQARILEWVAISFSNAWKRKVKVKSLSCVRLLATLWTAAYQAPLSMDFPGKSTGVGCHCLLCVGLRTRQ